MKSNNSSDLPLSKTNPILAKEWDFNKNTLLSPDDVTYGSNDKVWWLCEKGHSWKAKICNRTHGRGCPDCARINRGTKRRKTNKDFIDELSKINADIKPIEQYKGAKVKILVKCMNCGNVWPSYPTNLIRGHGCPVCAGVINKTHQDFVNELEKKNPDIEVIGKYKNRSTPVQVKCRVCGNVWNVKPGNALWGTGCPNCYQGQTSVIEQILYYSFAVILSRSIDVLNQNKDMIQLVQHRNTNIIGKELDVYIPSVKLAIEFGSWFWHKDRIAYDEEKEYLCLQEGIHLLTIYEYCPSDQLKNNDDSHYYYSYPLSAEKDYATIKTVIRNISKEYRWDTSLLEDSWSEIVSVSQRKARRKNTEQFINELVLVNPDVEVVGEYNGSQVPIQVRCKKCGYEWTPIPNNLLRGKKCKICAQKSAADKQRKTRDQFQSELFELNPNIELVGDYKGAWIETTFQCKVCKNEWSTKARYLLDTPKCPNCSGRIKRTHDSFVDEVHKATPSVAILGRYSNMHTKIQTRCLSCNYIWNAEPYKLINGRGCPVCSRKEANKKRKRTHEEFVCLVSESSPDIEVLGKYNNAQESIEVLCKLCKHKWKSYPSNLIKGCKCPNCNRPRGGRLDPRGVMCVETGKEYYSISQAQKETGLSSIRSCVSGHCKTAGGYHWKYIDSENK